jgi:signal transduction histidine kinase
MNNKQELRKMKDIKELDNLITEVSHEFRSPLNSIVGFSDMIRSETHGPIHEKYREYADAIHESGLFMLDLIGEILNPFNIEATKKSYQPEKFDAILLISEITNILKPQAIENKITIFNNIDDIELPVFLNKISLKQILFNLLSNAIKFSKNNANIYISASIESGNLIIEFQNSSKDATNQNFEIGKNGLGLFIVKSLIEQQSGGLKIENKKNTGTIVTMSLPFKI